MPRNSISTVPVFKHASAPPTHRITLTPLRTAPCQTQISVGIAELIAYSQATDFTRLNLTGGKVLDVQETTDQIDRLVRAAAAQCNSPQSETISETIVSAI